MSNPQTTIYCRLKFFGRLLKNSRFLKWSDALKPGNRHRVADKVGNAGAKSGIQKQAGLEQSRHNAEAVAAVMASRMIR